MHDGTIIGDQNAIMVWSQGEENATVSTGQFVHSITLDGTINLLDNLAGQVAGTAPFESSVKGILLEDQKIVNSIARFVIADNRQA